MTGKLILITQRDGSVWSIPVITIARSRAAHYAHEFENDIQRSLEEDTLPLFDEDPSEILEWAINNTNWQDVAADAKLHAKAPELTPKDFQKAWISGPKTVSAP